MKKTIQILVIITVIIFIGLIIFNRITGGYIGGTGYDDLSKISDNKIDELAQLEYKYKSLVNDYKAQKIDNYSYTNNASANDGADYHLDITLFDDGVAYAKENISCVGLKDTEYGLMLIGNKKCSIYKIVGIGTHNTNRDDIINIVKEKIYNKESQEGVYLLYSCSVET